MRGLAQARPKPEWEIRHQPAISNELFVYPAIDLGGAVRRFAERDNKIAQLRIGKVQKIQFNPFASRLLLAG